MAMIPVIIPTVVTAIAIITVKTGVYPYSFATVDINVQRFPGFYKCCVAVHHLRPFSKHTVVIYFIHFYTVAATSDVIHYKTIAVHVILFTIDVHLYKGIAATTNG